MVNFKHKYVPSCTPETVVEAISALWHAKNKRNDDILLCVLKDELEITAVRNALGGALAGFNSCTHAEMANSRPDPPSWSTFQGRVGLMNCRELHGLLASTVAPVETNITLLLFLGCGLYHMDMALACIDLHRWVQTLNHSSINIWTLSLCKESIFTCAKPHELQCGPPPDRPALEPSSLTPEILKTRFASWFQETAEYNSALKVAFERIWAQGLSPEHLQSAVPKQTGRVMSFLPVSELEQVIPEERLRSFVTMLQNHIDEAKFHVLRQTSFPLDYKIIRVSADVGLLEPVQNLSYVLCHGTRRGFVFDHYLEQMVWCSEIPMSDSEMRYLGRIRSDTGRPRVLSFPVRDSAPQKPLWSPAFTENLKGLILHLCAQPSGLNVDEVLPIMMPYPMSVIEGYLERYETQNLVVRAVGAQERFHLTNAGICAKRLYHEWGIQNLGAICLFLSALEQRRRHPLGNTALAAALLVLAAVVTKPMSITSPIGDFLGFLRLEEEDMDMDMFKEEGSGFAARYMDRGPIWAAVAIWMDLERQDGNQSLQDSNEVDKRCNGHLEIHHGTVKLFRDTKGKLLNAWKTFTTEDLADVKIKLDDREMQLLEVEMSRAWRHNTVFVPVEEEEPAPGTEFFFAYDILNNSPLARHTEDFVDWEAFSISDTPQENQPGVFGIYTFLQETDTKRIFEPRDVTYLSTNAMRGMLKGDQLRHII